MKLKKTSALVTGAGQRIGQQLAIALGRAGCDVVIHYRQSAEGARETAAMIESAGQKALLCQGDLRCQSDARRVAQQAIDWQDNLAVVVNSAATFDAVPFQQIEQEDWAVALETNLLGPFWISQLAGEWMKKAGRGKIINIADTSWMAPWPGYLPYSISKAGVVALTRGLAQVLAPTVQVNAIGPGAVMFPESYSEQKKQAVIAKTLRKAEGSPEDVCQAMLFLCECDYVTGTVIPVEGGELLGRGQT